MIKENKNNIINGDQVFLFKLITGELIMGIFDYQINKSMENNDKLLLIKYPVKINQLKNQVILNVYNPLSRMNFIIIAEEKIVYIDFPNVDLIDFYKKFLLNLKSNKQNQNLIDDNRVIH